MGVGAEGSPDSGAGGLEATPGGRGHPPRGYLGWPWGPASFTSKLET